MEKEATSCDIGVRLFEKIPEKPKDPYEGWEEGKLRTVEPIIVATLGQRYKDSRSGLEFKGTIGNIRVLGSKDWKLKSGIEVYRVLMVKNFAIVSASCYFESPTGYIQEFLRDEDRWRMYDYLGDPLRVLNREFATIVKVVVGPEISESI